ncbi:MAG: putative family peptidase [Gemmatimonadetes bacterium]|nr:putative family peptidase [Gemmatimonadota bacterium]
MRPAALTAALLSLIVSGSASGQGAAPTYQPGIDVRNYDVGITLPDTGSFILGDVTIALRRSAGIARLTLDLVDALNVRRVEVGGRVVSAPHVNNTIDVPLDGSDDSVNVRVVYDGVVRDGLVVQKDAKGRWTWFGDNWPDRARQWLPTVDHPSDKATVSWRITAPAERTVVANGEQAGTRPFTVNGKKLRETRWRESRPVPTYVMVLAAGPLERFDIRENDCHYGDLGQCVRQSVYVMPENRKWLPGVFLSVGPIVSLFERLIGPFPYEKLAHLQSSTRFGGMENASNIFYDGKLFPTQSVKDGLIAHETAHQWFGDAVTEREWSHVWLSEGFATYFAALWTQYIRGDGAYRAEMAGIRTQLLGDKVVATRPVIDSTQTELLALLNTNSYQKGGYILYMLHQQLGDSAFFGAIKSYYKNNRHGTVLSDDLRVELEKTSHQSLRQFFDQWLRRPGVAEPAIGWAFDAESGSVALRVVQKSAYELELPVVVTDAAGTVSRLMVKVPADSLATVPLPGKYSAKPRSITYDPDGRMLARITRL